MDSSSSVRNSGDTAALDHIWLSRSLKSVSFGLTWLVGAPNLTTLWLPIFDSRSHNPHTSLQKVSLKMRISAAAGFVALCSLLRATAAHNIQLKAHDRECFHESLHRDDKMTVTFQVGDREFGGAGNLDIDFWVTFNAARSMPIILRGLTDTKSSRRLRNPSEICLNRRPLLYSSTRWQICLLLQQ